MHSAGKKIANGELNYSGDKKEKPACTERVPDAISNQDLSGVKFRERAKTQLVPVLCRQVDTHTFCKV
jgi:hypothetical protein